MKQLKVLKPFRDENNFFLMHEVGEVLTVNAERAARLMEGGVCEEFAEEKKVKAAEKVQKPEPEPEQESEQENKPEPEATREPERKPENVRKTRKNSRR